MLIKADGKVHQPMQGVKMWKNKRNKFCVFELHYSADESKRSDQFKDAARSGLSTRKYLQEYELSWDSWAGLPVYGDTWNEQFHSTPNEIDPVVGLPLLLGIDNGLTPAAIVCQLEGQQLRILTEIVEVNMGAERFSDLLANELRLLYPRWSDLKRNWRTFMDPSGMYRKDTDENTCFNIFVNKGFEVIPGAIPFEERRTSVEDYLRKTNRGEPCLLVSSKNCPMLTKGFSGGYQFREEAAEIEPNKLRPIKNQYSHIHDALQMVTTGIKLFNANYFGSNRAKEPSYGGR